MRMITKSEGAKTVKELQSGECFRSGGEYYIATDKCLDDNYRECVAVLNGGVTEFHSEVRVKTVDAEVVIND